MAWQGIEGHDDVAARFVAAHDRGRIAGSYLFVGPPGVGKAAFALALAKALVCQSPRAGLAACDACASCVQAQAGSHPDIDVVRKPEDRSTIPLEAFIGDTEHRMREGLCWRMLLRPALGGRRVAIILDADHLADEAANSLLKTLEEPPGQSVIILVGTALERQLPTIRSRARVRSATGPPTPRWLAASSPGRVIPRQRPRHSNTRSTRSTPSTATRISTCSSTPGRACSKSPGWPATPDQADPRPAQITHSARIRAKWRVTLRATTTWIDFSGPACRSIRDGAALVAAPPDPATGDGHTMATRCGNADRRAALIVGTSFLAGLVCATLLCAPTFFDPKRSLPRLTKRPQPWPWCPRRFGRPPAWATWPTWLRPSPYSRPNAWRSVTAPPSSAARSRHRLCPPAVRPARSKPRSQRRSPRSPSQLLSSRRRKRIRLSRSMSIRRRCASLPPGFNPGRCRRTTPHVPMPARCRCPARNGMIRTA
ncbi:MAG: AAA family ATPase [Planctomycetia bacterium]|nr:AAA family ATPase [Planctomycetia bacterium]